MVVLHKRNIIKTLSLLIALAGILVMIGWIFNISVLKSILPVWVSMKFDTSIAFVLSGVTLYFIVRAQEGEFDKAQVVISITSLIIVLLMGMLFFSAIFKIRTGLENLFIEDNTVTSIIVAPGQPSLPTMLNFMLVALAGILTLLNPEKLRTMLKIIGSIISVIGAAAVSGYILNIPILYYFIAGVNTAMACHTAVLFVLLGAGLICL